MVFLAGSPGWRERVSRGGFQVLKAFGGAWNGEVAAFKAPRNIHEHAGQCKVVEYMVGWGVR